MRSATIVGLAGLAVFVVGAAVWLVLTQDRHAAEGRRLYAYYCSHCHGPKGLGDGYNATHMDPHPRDLTDRDEQYMAELTNDQIVEAIQKGGRGIETTPLMPAFGQVLSEMEMYSLTAYLRTLHPYKGKPVTFAPTLNVVRPIHPPVPRAEFVALHEAETRDRKAAPRLVEEGRQFYGEYGCDGCHRVASQGGEVGPDLTRAGFRLQPEYIYRWIRNPQAIKPHSRMPNLGLSEHEAVAVTLYLGTLRGEPVQGDPVQGEP